MRRRFDYGVTTLAFPVTEDQIQKHLSAYSEMGWRLEAVLDIGKACTFVWERPVVASKAKAQQGI